jgi:hypothetical protein
VKNKRSGLYHASLELIDSDSTMKHVKIDAAFTCYRVQNLARASERISVACMSDLASLLDDTSKCCVQFCVVYERVSMALLEHFDAHA